jgi:hypothetical protein
MIIKRHYRVTLLKQGPRHHRKQIATPQRVAKPMQRHYGNASRRKFDRERPRLNFEEKTNVGKIEENQTAIGYLEANKEA